MDKLLDFYTDYLISSTRQTIATGLSRLLDNVISHDCITRFLSSYSLAGNVLSHFKTDSLFFNYNEKSGTKEFTY